MEKWQTLFDKIIGYSFYLLFFLTPLVFTKINYELFEFPKMILVYVLTSVIVASWLGKMVDKGEIRIQRTPLDLPILLYLASSVLSTVFSIDQHTSFWGYYSRFHGGLMSTICYVLLYYAFMSNLSQDKKRVLSYLQTLLLSAFFVAIYGILERLGIDDQYWIQDVKSRVFSSLGQPNWLGAFLTALIFIPLALLWQELGKKRKENKKIIIYCLLFVVYLLCLIFTNSKSAILAFWLCFGLFTLLAGLKATSFKSKTLLLIGLLSLASYLLLGGKTYQYLSKLPTWIKSFSAPASQITTTSDPSVKYGHHISGTSDIRRIVWQGALKIWQAYPVFGSGLETFGYAYYNFRPKEHNLLSEWDFLYNKAHNEFLNILACQGTLGILSYLFLILSFLLWSIKVKNNPYHLPLLCGYISILITNFFGFSVVIIGLLFFMIPCFSFSLGSQKKQTRFSLKLPVLFSETKYFSFILVFGFLLYSLFSIFSLWRADYHFNKGQTLYKTNYLLPSLGQLEKAIKLNKNEAIYHAFMAKTAAKLAVVYADMEATESAQLAPQLSTLAQSEINETLKLNKVHLNFYKNKAEVYLLLSYLEPELKEKAINALWQATKLAPTDAKLLYNLGIFYFDEDKNMAIQLWENSLILKPNYTRVYIKLAEVYQEMGETEKARQKLEFVLKNIDPIHAGALTLLEEL